VHLVELTDAGEEAFHRLRLVAMEHDARLREGFSDEDLERLRGLLGRLRANVADGAGASAGAATG
jgi:MarR family transcriptional regulator for hemolysin